MDLVLKNIRKTFGSFVAIKDINLEIKQGKLVYLNGESGSGKTTLMGIMSGILKADSGQILYDNNDISLLNEKALDKFRLDNFSFVFQSYNLFTALTAVQNVEIFLKWGFGYSSKECRAKSEAILADLGLSHRLNVRPYLLSGGEKQRVAIARAMVKRPKYLFADVPTSALDSKNGSLIVKLLKEQVEKGTTVILISHDERIKKYADTIIKIEDGAII